jgi:CRISPR-associated protein Cas1
VKSGDPENVEARAASYYWGKYFEYLALWIVRHRFGAPPNNALNYGYDILRAIVARALVGSGCLPAVGIHPPQQIQPFLPGRRCDGTLQAFCRLLCHATIYNGWTTPEKLDKNWKATLLKVPVIDTKSMEKKVH